MCHFDAALKLVRDTLGEALLQPLLPIIRGAPDPVLALNGLHRLAGTPELPVILKQGRVRELIKILGFSPFFTTTLAVRPQLLTELFMGDALNHPKDEAAMLRELDRLIPGDAPLEVLQRELRRFKRQEALRIAARDLGQIAKVPKITAEIADLASASLRKALAVCEHLVRSRYGAPHESGGRPAELVILGMGKLGGRELNFSSDIDLICFSSSSEGETEKGVPLTVFFRRLVNLLIKAISQPTADGFVFRVDLGLRPEGRSGEIAQSLSFAENYYESWGQAWERFALLKARPVAGNLALGEKLLTTLRPFIYRRYLDFGMVEELKQMQHKIREALRQRADQGDDDIKLGRGGIREIEFFVQTLQLIHAGKH
ncbi:MAG: bifunctional, partial [Deltaproteobacteria bacterium]|nr:bifunctional [glutamate--ammonia ligase]-adenylyl-L-tyrosine phosphorylase/[glutamate--ammonia-ligase] adenylyltransferase [Deltaproteobacteria bacterium]